MNNKFTFSGVWKGAKSILKEDGQKIFPLMFILILMIVGTSMVPVSLFGGSFIMKNIFDLVLSLIVAPLLVLVVADALINRKTIKASFKDVCRNWKGALGTTYLVIGITYSFFAIIALLSAITVGALIIAESVTSSVIPMVVAGVSAILALNMVILAVVIAIKYSFAIYIWVDKKISGFKALAASRELVNGNMEKAACYLGLFYLLTIDCLAIPFIAIAILKQSSAVTAVVMGLIMFIVSVFAIPFMVSLYKEMLATKEEFGETGFKAKKKEKILAIAGLIIFAGLMVYSVITPTNKDNGISTGNVIDSSNSGGLNEALQNN